MASFENKQAMKAAQGKDYGPIKEMITVEENVPIPRLSSLSKNKRKNFLIVRTLAVSLAPGDVRTLSGLTREFQGPPHFPYIPGGDCCGIVVEISNEKGKYDENFDVKVGDIVAARFFDFPRNCLAEYAIVHKGVCEKVVNSGDGKIITAIDAAALASASPAILVADRIQKGERVLVLGAGGGLGSHLCQCLRIRGVSNIAGVSRNPDRLLEEPLSYDIAIDYTKENVWEKEEFLQNPFDVIIDLAGGGWPKIQDVYKKGAKRMIIKNAKQGGRYITTTPDNPIFELHSIWDGLKVILFPALWRALYSRTYYRKSLPKYTYGFFLPDTRDVLTRTLKEAKDGRLVACIDGPFSFTTDGVQDAFCTQESHHAKGKIVVKIADN